MQEIEKKILHFKVDLRRLLYDLRAPGLESKVNGLSNSLHKEAGSVPHNVRRRQSVSTLQDKVQPK
jgi:hypothetical protein